MPAADTEGGGSIPSQRRQWDTAMSIKWQKPVQPQPHTTLDVDTHNVHREAGASFQLTASKHGHNRSLVAFAWDSDSAMQLSTAKAVRHSLLCKVMVKQQAVFCLLVAALYQCACRASRHGCSWRAPMLGLGQS